MREHRTGPAVHLYYSAGWQVLEEQVASKTRASFVWSPVYVDALVCRDRDADGLPGNGLEERLYPLHDANFNVVGLVNTSGTVVERYRYDPYGGVTVLDGAWAVRAGGTAYAWVNLWQGLRRDPVTGTYSAGYREIHATLGRAMQPDPLGFGAGDANFYRWERNQPTNVTDPSGLDVPISFAMLQEMWNAYWHSLWGGFWGQPTWLPYWNWSYGGYGSGGGGYGGYGYGYGGGYGGIGEYLGRLGGTLEMLERRLWGLLRELFPGASPTPWPDLRDVSNLFAGWADGLTGGLTQKARAGMGTDDAVDKNSRAYQTGLVIGQVHGLAIAVAGGLPGGGMLPRLGGGGGALPGRIPGALPGGPGGASGRMPGAAPGIRPPGNRAAINPVAEINRNADIATELARRAAARGRLNGKPQDFGNHAHEMFRRLNERLNRRLIQEGSPYRVSAEEFRNAAGRLTARRAPGSIGPDVIVRRVDDASHIQIFDLKTHGGAINPIRPSRQADILTRFGAYASELFRRR